MEFANPASSSEEDFDESDQEEEEGEELEQENEDKASSSDEDNSSEDEDMSEKEDDVEESILTNKNNFRNSNQSMEELLKLRDKIGTKNFNKNFNKTSEVVCDRNALNNERKRQNKNRPQELSSKQKWRSNKQIVKSNKTRDPRFDDLCGSAYNAKIFDKRYAFVHEVQDKEIKQLKKQMRRKRGDTTVLKDVISRMEEKQKARKRKLEDDEVLKKWRKEENDKIAKGKKPYFLKKAEVKKLQTDHRRNKLQEDGMLDKVTRKKQKKLAGKEKKNLPERRNKVN